jgi:hypothetical protein
MKVIVTTSGGYEHLVKIFTYLFNKNWGPYQQVELVGYEEPKDLPDNFTFYSLGKQKPGKHNFSNDLRPYFKMQEQWFIWIFEDTFVRGINLELMRTLRKLLPFTSVGRINLSTETMKQKHKGFAVIDGYAIYENTNDAKYRLSTQPSIWNRDYLLQYLKPNLSPWEFETQKSTNDGWRILGPDQPALISNEGVRKHNLYDYNFHGVQEDQLTEMKQLGII